MSYREKFRRTATRIVAQQRQLREDQFSPRDKALVNRISAGMVSSTSLRDVDHTVLLAYSEVQMLLLSAKRKKDKDKDAGLPEAAYAVVSALKAITGSSGQAIAAIRDKEDVGMSDEDAIALAEELQDAAEKIKKLLKRVKS
jgi:hypothetical protein